MIIMDDSTRSPEEVNSPACLNKKRKLQNEPREMPLSKHACCNQIPNCDSSSDRESATDSNSLECNTGSFMSTDTDETKTNLVYVDTCGSDEASSSSESRSLAGPRSIGPESSSTEKHDRTDCHQCGVENLNSGYDGHLMEFGNEVDYSFSGYGSGGNCRDNEIENMNYANGIAPSDYVLSSGRWSVIQDTQEEGKRLTIDKEFEQYFSMLML